MYCTDGLDGFLIFQIIAWLLTAYCFVAPEIVILTHAIGGILELMEGVGDRWGDF
jgi:hypothetical protein